MSKLAAAKPCAGCGHTEFTRDFLATAGDILCLRCGMVQIENPIVSEVQFGESSSGAATVQGAMVGADQARAYNMRNSLESREQTLMNAKSKIKLLAAAIRIPDYIQDSAHGWFKLALVQNFVQGRRSQNVIAACLYVACRHEKTPHLLIDFSSRLQISVYSLGATYLKLVRALQIQRLPLADPSLFIQHFAERLNFAEHTAKVCRDATKIAQRMSSDWIYEGRRPAGIAGACLLLAARMNNFRRSHAEIVAVAKVGEETLQKRLNEFKKTSLALLSVLEFRESSHTNDSQPPSFQNNRAIEFKIERLLKQQSHTLKKYRELARKRQLFTHLKMDGGQNSVSVSSGNERSETGDLGIREDAEFGSLGVVLSGTVNEPGNGMENEVQNGTQTVTETESHKDKGQIEPESHSEIHLSNKPNAASEKDAENQVDIQHIEYEKQTNVLGHKETLPEEPHQVHQAEFTNLWGYVRPDLQIGTSTVNENQDTSNVHPNEPKTRSKSRASKLKPVPVIRTARTKPADNTEISEEQEEEEEGEVNELFVPRSDDEDDDNDDDPFGYNTLPDNLDNADADYEAHHRKIVRIRHRSLRPSTRKTSQKAARRTLKTKELNAAREQKKTSTSGSRLGSITSSRAGSVQNISSIKNSNASTIRSRAQAKADQMAQMQKKKLQLEELKKQKERRKAEELEARDDELLKAVLSGGDIKEEDLEIALDRILQGQKKLLSSCLYRTPAEIQNETDIARRIELDRPRNLVQNNPTTKQILARVRDDEMINTDDEDDEVMDIRLTEEEKQQKERIWIALNHDFLIAQERKRLKIEADELTGNTSGQPRKRRRIKEADPILDDDAVASAIQLIEEGGKMLITPAENAKQMLQKKLFSRKINYSSIGDLFNE